MKKAKKLTAEELAAKHQVAVNTFVREVWGEIPRELEVKLKSLKAWGFDLIAGLREGEPAVFVASQEAGHLPGDVYEERGERFEVKEVLDRLPKGAKLVVRVSNEERRGVARLYYRAANGEETELFALPAAELLLAFFKKRGWGKLLEAFHSSGLTTEFIQSRGSGGKAWSFKALPPKMRRALREGADTIKKRAGVGRFTLVYFGKNKDGDDRYVVTWLLPTIKLLDVSLAEHVEGLLAALD
ncbi:TIGR00703 family protein [Oceanithermus sp.]